MAAASDAESPSRSQIVRASEENMRPIGWSLATLTALGLGLAGCGDARPTQTTGGGGGGGVCTVCHGDAKRTGNLPGTGANLAAAPPVGTHGETLPTQPAVGAHQAHLNPPATGSLTGPLACANCHDVPSDTAHATNPPAQIVHFNLLATTGGAAPTWNSTDKTTNTTCSSVYCHGNFTFGSVTGTTTNAPDWTQGSTQATCGSCHGLPPTGHVALSGTVTAATCNGCHPGTVASDGTIIVNVTTGASLHVNGQVNEGAHSDPNWYVDPAINPSFTPVGGDHTTAALAYTAPGTGVQGCLQCHVNFGSPTGAASSSCNSCHASALARAVTTDWRQNCVFCHGDKTKLLSYAAADQTSDPWIIAPPVGTKGETLTTDLAVGAHQKHANPGTGYNVLSNAIACTECHPSPLPTDVAHVDGVVDLPLAGPLATNPTGTFTPSPTWTAPGCSATYCHGNYPQGGNVTTPVWTQVDGSFAACTSCHGAPPNTGQHYFHIQSVYRNCANCHQGIATGSGSSVPVTNATIVPTGGLPPPQHVNGARDVVFGGTYGGNPVTGTWTPAPTSSNAAAGSCDVSCHSGSRSW